MRVITSLLIMLTIFISQPDSLAYENINQPDSPAYEDSDHSRKEDGTVTYGIQADFNSLYLYRGFALSEGAVVQPSAWVSAFDFTFETWGNFVLNDEPNQGEFNEVHLTLYYIREWEKITFEPAVTYYFFPNLPEDIPNTAEVYLRVSYPVWMVSVFTAHTLDFLEFKGFYFGEAGLFYGHEFHSKLSLDAAASVGWASSEFNDALIGLPKSALNVTGGSVSLRYYLKDFVYIRPHLELSVILDDDLRSAVDDPAIINFGLAVGMEF